MDQDWLDDRAEQEVKTRKVPALTTGVTSVRSEEFDVLMNVLTGDWLPVRIDHGMIQNDDWRRVYTKKYNAGTNSVDLTFGEIVTAP